jgi:hypothetical protein
MQSFLWNQTLSKFLPPPDVAVWYQPAASAAIHLPPSPANPGCPLARSKLSLPAFFDRYMA